jgi:hypothetical protein
VVAAPPAHADGEVPPHRFADTSICVIQADSMKGKGWRVAGALHEWNTAFRTAGLPLTLHNTAVPGCSVVTVQPFTPPSPDCILGDGAGCAGYVTYSGWVEGEMLPNGLWAYRHATVWLTDDYRPRKCSAKTISAHEIGHTLGLPHDDDPLSVMSYAYDHSDGCGRPGASDVANLALLYAPVGG